MRHARLAVTFLMCLALCSASSCAASVAKPAAENAEPVKPAAVEVTAKEAPTTVVQPTKIPGPWKLVDLPLPPFERTAKRPAASLPVYGLYTWCGEYKEHRDSIRKVGWNSVRIGGALNDEAMTLFCQDGVEVMKTLGLRDVNPTGDKKNRTGYDADEPFIADYVKGIERFLSRYGPGGTFFKDHPDVPVRPILHVEIWNEPNFQYMIPPREGTPRPQIEAEREALYAKVLPAAYKAVKAKWPTVHVVGFGAGGASAGDLRWFKNVHAKSPEVAKSYDIASTHPYSPPVPPEAWHIKSWGGFSMATSLDTIRKTLAGHGRGNVPIWYTEMGWPISKADGGHFDTDPKKEYATPLLQAAYVCRAYAMAMRLRVERVHIMFATDTDNFNGGFFLRDKSWRPSAKAVQTMIRLMPHPKLTKALSDGKDGYYAYRFDPDTRPIGDRRPMEFTMAWNVAGPRNVELPCPAATAMVIDMLGHRKTVKAADGNVAVEVGPCPVYVIAFTDSEE